MEHTWMMHKLETPMKKGNSSDGNRCNIDFGNFQVEHISYKWVRTEMDTVTSQRSHHSRLLIAHFRQRCGFLWSKQLLPSSGSIFSPPRPLSRAIPCAYLCKCSQKSFYFPNQWAYGELTWPRNAFPAYSKGFRDCQVVKLIGNLCDR